VSLPMSARTAESEQAYQDAKVTGKTMPLELEPSLKQWVHWRMIDNRFPYDMIFSVHRMLLPKRAGVSDRWHLNKDEKEELEVILKEFVYPEFDMWFENCPKRRSVASMYHIHLGTYREGRDG
jgi:hypothetical protein